MRAEEMSGTMTGEGMTEGGRVTPGRYKEDETKDEGIGYDVLRGGGRPRH